MLQPVPIVDATRNSTDPLHCRDEPSGLRLPRNLSPISQYFPHLKFLSTCEVLMRRHTLTTASLVIIAAAVYGALSPLGHAQEITRPAVSTGALDFHIAASNLIIPQTRSYPLLGQTQQIQISEV